VTEPVVTALIPVKTYHPPFLRAAVGSLLGQTSPRWTAVLIHSRGLRNQVASDLGAACDDARIELIEQRGRRLAGAINTGMRAAPTDFVAILLGDDLWAPEAVDVLGRSIAARPEVDFFHSSRRIVDDEGEPISGVHEALGVVTPDMFIDGPVKHLLCWRRELALSIGGIDESLDSVGTDDYDFPWSMMEAGARFAAIPQCLYVYRDHRSCERLTTHLPLRIWERGLRHILRKHGVRDEIMDARIAAVQSGYLRQCLYSSRLDAWIGRALGRDPARGWRESYR
jgi:glycosyltransferase involved in cell wall biosynthesis